MSFWLLNILRDARRYRVLREELTDRFVLGTTCHSPEELDGRVDAALDGTICDVLRAEDEERQRRMEKASTLEFPPPSMAGWRPLFGKPLPEEKK